MRVALLLLLTASASAQTFTERFDAVAPGALPAGWSRFQTDAPPEAPWAVQPLGPGQQAAQSDYGSAASGRSALVTPAFTPRAGDVLRFRAAELTAVPATTTLEVRAGPAGSTTAFPVVLATVEASALPRPDGPFGLVQVDLAPIAGQRLRLAFVHVNTVTRSSDAGGVLYLDDVVVGLPPSGPRLVVTREPEAFGIVGVGRTVQTRARLENQGGAPLTLSQGLSEPAGIGIEAPPDGTVLGVGASAEVVFTFAPTATGDASATIGLISDGGSVILGTTGTGGQISAVDGTTVGGQPWTPPRILGARCTPAEDAGTFVTAGVSVSVSGRYRFAGQFGAFGDPAPAFGTFTLYDGAVDPGAPCDGAVLVLGPNLRVSGEVDLVAGQPYRLASSTYSGLGNTPPGPFSAELVGPGAVAFSTAGADAPGASALSVEVVGANPSRGRVRVSVRGASGPTRVEAFDVLGRRVAVLFDGTLGSGAQEVSAPALAPGVYTVRAATARAAASQRVTVVR